MAYTREDIIANSVRVLPVFSVDVWTENTETGESSVRELPAYSYGSGTIIRGEADAQGYREYYVLTNMHVSTEREELSSFILKADEALGVEKDRHFYWIARGGEVLLAESAIFAGTDYDCGIFKNVEDMGVLRVLQKEEAAKMLNLFAQQNIQYLGERYGFGPVFEFSLGVYDKQKVMNPLIEALSFPEERAEPLVEMRQQNDLQGLFAVALENYAEDLSGVAIDDLQTPEFQRGDMTVTAGFSENYVTKQREAISAALGGVAISAASRVLEPYLAEMPYIEPRGNASDINGWPYVYNATEVRDAVAPGSSGGMNYKVIGDNAYIPAGLQFARSRTYNGSFEHGDAYGYAAQLDAVGETLRTLDVLYQSDLDITTKFPVSDKHKDYCANYRSGFAKETAELTP